MHKELSAVNVVESMIGRQLRPVEAAVIPGLSRLMWRWNSTDEVWLVRKVFRQLKELDDAQLHWVVDVIGDGDPENHWDSKSHLSVTSFFDLIDATKALRV